jgi:rhodanese-related sulfurtransferase
MDIFTVIALFIMENFCFFRDHFSEVNKLHRKTFLNIDLVKLTVIIVLAIATAFLYNYFNPEGLTIVSLQEEETIVSEPGEVKFYQPVSVDSEDAFLLYENNVQFIDVRSPGEHNEGYIPNSINLPTDQLDNLKEILSSFQEDTPLVIYGRNNSDQSMEAVAEELFKIDFNRIYIYTDGFEEWVKNNYPVSR